MIAMITFFNCLAGCSEIPEVENAELAQSSRKNNYSDGDKLDYNCKHGYASSLNITYICRDNKWTKSHAENCSRRYTRHTQTFKSHLHLVVCIKRKYSN